jgi:hypothetical protein
MSRRNRMPIPEYHRYRACTGKVRHQTRREAEEVATRMARVWHLGPGVRLEPYWCPFCYCFHTGRRYDS